MNQYTLFLTLAPLALVASVGIIAYGWRQRDKPLARNMAVLMLPPCGYLVTNSLELLDPTARGTMFWAKAGYWFAPLVPIVWVAFALEYTGRYHWLDARRSWAILILPLITAALAQTNELHHLIWTSVTFPVRDGFLTLSVTYGPWFWVHLTYSYLLIVTGILLVVSEFIVNFHVFGRQSIWILAGIGVPFVANLIYTFQLIPGWRKDYSPIGFACTGIVIFVGIFRYRLVNLMPIARSLVMDYMDDGICVLDRTGLIIDVNQALTGIVGNAVEDLVGKPAGVALSFWKGIPDGDAPYSTAITVPGAAGRRSYDLRVVRLARPQGQTIGRLVTLHDVTERNRLLAVVEQMAITDPLTGLYNRRHFARRADEELERSHRLGHPVALMMLDLDHFKLVNDTRGHDVGDQVLVAVAGLLRAQLRRIDLLARFGGEEFVILLPETGPVPARAAAERIRLQMAGEPLPTTEGPITMTTSIGLVCVAGTSTLTLTEMLHSADRALYGAKQAGRDAVYGDAEMIS